MKPLNKLFTYTDSYDLSNVMMFALGVEMRYIRTDYRSTVTVTAETMLMDPDLCHLRAFCIVRSIAIKRFQAMCREYEFERKSFAALLHFPDFVTRTLIGAKSDILTMTGPLPQRFEVLDQSIDSLTKAVRKYIPVEEEHPEYLLSMFESPRCYTYEGLDTWRRDFTRVVDNYAFRVWYHGGYSSVVFNSDFVMMFEVYKGQGKQLPNPALYKNVRRTIRAKANYDTLEGSSAALEFLKASLAEVDERRIALVDTQNMKASTVYDFFRWVQGEFPQAFEEVILFVDGREYWNWNIAETVIDMPVTRVNSKRILDGKSTVDTTLTAYAVQLYYEAAPDVFYVFSGDCDFIPLTDILPDAKFCFCGMSGATSSRSLEAIKHRGNTEFIILDELLGCIKARTGGRSMAVDEVIACLNKEKLNISALLEPVRSICNSLGKRSDDVIAVSLLNQAFSSCHVRVTDNGCLEFKPPWEHWDWRDEGVK